MVLRILLSLIVFFAACANEAMAQLGRPGERILFYGIEGEFFLRYSMAKKLIVKELELSRPRQETLKYVLSQNPPRFDRAKLNKWLARLQDAFTKQQQRRLYQMWLQHAGASALITYIPSPVHMTREELHKSLGLSQQQKDKLLEIARDASEQRREFRRKPMRERLAGYRRVEQARDQRLEAQLNPKQKLAWKTLQGKPSISVKAMKLYTLLQNELPNVDAVEMPEVLRSAAQMFDEWSKSPRYLRSQLNQLMRANKGQLPSLQAKEWLNSPPLELAKLRGKVVLLVFCNVTNESSVDQLDKLQNLHVAQAKQGLAIIAIHSAKSAERCRSLKEKRKWTFPIAIDTGATFKSYSAHRTPLYIVLARNGRSVTASLGEMPKIPDLQP